ncbi:hypothetical protein J4E83_011052 [Alternaria metachromatica]|uniref:uncharacterized protein n=1 Tax=Alternaria metachromatica TaxID=283354 RepID=UPI0020C3C8E8|nr:uncharacterized protein J4E83_011052 [Alternaria metachromatica]KAI4604633.1 hypothetical protein J4E83_011052 [Alternaria metachromatica]
MDVDTKMTDASDVDVVSRLLELPGELRNHIYSIIVAAEEARGVKLHRKRRGRSQHSKHALRDRHPSRQFLGLAQTNQLFRSEFWPLYTKAHRPIINIEELAEYLEVVPHSDEYINSSIITTLEAVRLLKTPKAVEAPGIDIRPLFRMKWKSFPFIKMTARKGQTILVEQLEDISDDV